jgi:hypothetical protein
MGIKMDYKNTDYPTLSTRDKYLSWQEIDTRQLAELRSLMDRWKQGLSVWEVMWEFGRIMDVWAFSSFRSVLKTGSDEMAELEPHIRPSFLEAPLSEQTIHSIESLCQHMEDRPDLNSFDFAEIIARAVLLEFEGPPEPRIPTNPTLWNLLTEPPESDIPLDSLLRDLERLRLIKTRETEKIVGSLRPKSEAEFAEPLDPYIQRMRKGWEYEGYPQLIKAMTVDASGSGDIKPFRFNPDHLPPECQSTKEADPFDPYATDDPEDSGWQEDIYGTTIALVTTYSIRFEPCSADQLEDLAAKVELAVKLIGIIPPTFGIPADYESRPYKRPFFPAHNPNDIEEPERKKIAGPVRDDSETPLTPEQNDALIQALLECANGLENNPETYYTGKAKSWGYGTPRDVRSASFISSGRFLPTHCEVGIKDGKVEIYTRLDLDDTFRLYYLLEHLMVPSIETARALNAARFMEARSAPQQKNEPESRYSTDNIPAHEQVGHLAEKRPDEILPTILQAAKDLYDGKIISEEGLLEQVIAAATHTVLGTIADPSGAFTPHDKLLTDGRYAGKDGLPITLQQAVEIRTRQFLRIIAGLDPDSPEPLANALFQASVGRSESVRNQWRLAARNREIEIREMVFNSERVYDFNDVINEAKRELSISDILTGYAARRAEEERRFGIASKENQSDTGSRFSDLQKTASENNPNPITREVARIQLEQLRVQDDQEERGKEAYDAWQKQMPASRTGLVLRDPDVPPCGDILYEGTIYTSRLKGSGVPRHELPRHLRKLLEPEADPYQSAVSRICLNPESEAKNPAPIEGRNPQP